MSLFALLLVGSLPTTGVSAQFACEPAAPAAASPAATPEIDRPVIAFPDEGGTVTVFAAASLVDAFGEMESVLEERYPGLDIVLETAGSQTLVTQLREGAQADVLATANLSTMATAEDEGLVSGPAVPFTGNRLLIVAPDDNPAGITDVQDLARDGVLLVLAGQDVPAGNYAHQALCAYAAVQDTPDFLDKVWGNVASEEVDVRSVLAKVQLGEADAGIVYASDAEAARLSGTPLTTIEFPAGVPTTAVYPIAPATGGDDILADAFISFVLSDEGQNILAVYGFGAN